jgi:SpoVK/Ycf46/Vps4 family AAA+-type ATPase
MGKGYWEFITGDDTKPVLPKNPTQQQIQANKTWHEKARKILYWLSMSVSDSMIVHIQDAKSPKQGWDTLVKMYSTNTQARKMQLKQELHNLQKNKMNISDYSTKVKNFADALASIGAPVDDEDLVAVTLNGLGKDYSQFCTSIAVRETFPNFQDLITLLISEEMRVVGTSFNGGSEESAFYSNSNRGRGRGAKTSF